MTCEECKASREPESIPYIAHESAMARNERKEKRMWFVIVLLIFAFVGSNAYWIYKNNQYEKVTTSYEVEQDAENGTNNFIGGDMNGEAEGQKDCN